MARISTTRLARLIGAWSEGEGPLPSRLGKAIGRLVTDRELPSGAVLPSERSLASTLSVSRSTVVGAYAALRETGMLDSRQGSGSRITVPSDLRGTNRAGVHTRLTGEEIITAPGVDMSSGALDPSPILHEVLRTISPSLLGEMVTGPGYHAAGLPQLRWAIARYYNDLGVPAHADNVMITNGAQQALWLLANALLDPTDPVVVEDPTYRGSLEVLRRRDARIFTVPISPAGIGVDQLESVIKRVRPKVVYLFSECQNPTGISMDDDHRRDLVALLNRHDVFLIDDGSQSELSLQSGHRPRPIVSELSPERAAAIGTLSKLFWGGLRIGWVFAAKPVIKRLISIKAASDLGSSVIDQNIAIHLLDRVSDARQLRHAELGRHLEVVESLIRDISPSWRWQRPLGGSALWIHVPGVDVNAVCQQAHRQHLMLSAGTGYSANENFGDYLRLPFVRPPEVLRAAIQTVADLCLPRGPL